MRVGQVVAALAHEQRCCVVAVVHGIKQRWELVLQLVVEVPVVFQRFAVHRVDVHGNGGLHQPTRPADGGVRLGAVIVNLVVHVSELYVTVKRDVQVIVALEIRAESQCHGVGLVPCL